MSLTEKLIEGRNQLVAIAEFMESCTKVSELQQFPKFVGAMVERSRKIMDVADTMRDMTHNLLEIEKILQEIEEKHLKVVQRPAGITRGDEQDDACSEALELCDEIESLADQVPERGEDFARSVLDRMSDIRATIEERNTATSGQIQALENMRDGLSRWIR